MEHIDITIIGAGVIGLSIASRIPLKNRKTFLLEKNASFGRETSSRNSEVIHSGIYYPNNSQKHLLCLAGRRLLYDLCLKHNINHKKTGKIIVATNEEEIKKLKTLYQNGLTNEVEGLKFLDKKEITKLNPNICAVSAILSKETGIIDSHGLMKYFLTKATDNGCEVSFNTEVINIEKNNNGYKITVTDADQETFSFTSTCVINCAGLNSDKIAQLIGIDILKENYDLHLTKGQYFRLYNHKKWNINNLVYPLPVDKLKGLGIHITLDLNNDIRLGPDTTDISKIDYSVDETAKKPFFESVKKFLPMLEESDLYPDTAGIRPKLKSAAGQVRDFIIEEESAKGLPNFINLISIESPGLTASLAIGEYVEKMIKKIF